MTLSDFMDKEEECVKELKHRLKGAMSPEMYADTRMFIRFLKARNYDLNASEKMLTNHLNWRKVNRTDTILQWYTPPKIAKFVPFTIIGFDHDGSPISYCMFSKLDFRGILKAVNMTDITNFIINLLEIYIELMRKQSEKLNKNIDQWVKILNFENFQLSVATHKPSLEVISKMISLYEANYPEHLKNVIVINASWYFQLGFSIVKPLITGPTLKKIKIYGKDGWQQELRELMDVDELPAFLGGNKTDPDGDPMCRSFVNHGCAIPEMYYAENSRVPLATQRGVKKLSVGRLAKKQVEMHVSYPDSEIEWEFETKGKDIAFSLLYKESNSSDTEPKELLPKQRIDTCIASEIGLFKCEKAGTYYLEFDNTYSWIYHKEVYYRTKVSAPREQSNGA